MESKKLTVLLSTVLVPGLVCLLFTISTRALELSDTLSDKELALIDVNSTGVNLQTPLPGQEPEPEYTDTLIDPTAVADDYAYEAGPQLMPQWLPGAVDVDLRYINRKVSQSQAVSSSRQDEGLSLTLQQESLGYGKLLVQTTVSQDPYASDTSFWLKQKDFALNRSWAMDNSVGQHFLSYPGMLLNSPRFRLSLPVIEGVSSQLSAEQAQIHLLGGKLGTLKGSTFPTFERTQGEVAGVSVTGHLGEGLEGGLLWWQLNDVRYNNNTSDHQAVLSGLRYRKPEYGYSGQVHLLANPGGGLGLWLDNRSLLRGWIHQYGVFRFDPELRWVDHSAPVRTDSGGAYWQAGYNRSSYGLGFGLDADRSLTDPDLGRMQFSSHGFYRFSRITQGQGRVSLVLDQRRTRLLGLNMGLGHKFSLGRSSWNTAITRSLNSGDVSDVRFSWDHGFSGLLDMQANVGLLAERRSRNGETESDTSVNIAISRHYQDFSVGGKAGLGYRQGSAYDGRNYSLNSNINWFIDSNFLMNAELVWEKNALDSSVLDSVSNNQFIMVSLKYNQDWGRRSAVFAGPGACNGFGAIQGYVFADSNNDAVRDSTEKPLAGVTVHLDASYSAKTDADGRYEFSPVSCGAHQVSINIADVPLPWGLDNEEPEVIVVETRETHSVDFGLHDISWVDLNTN
ncbi:MAG: hypothetical protein OEZ68_01630 [Gammaproteobacteria bacterium]|nr:hypothetical protein [Gammaproteobacteria bacterium]MDH5799480.1 hypothetical protein [Gammaproteobacteria bacterium]